MLVPSSENFKTNLLLIVKLKTRIWYRQNDRHADLIIAEELCRRIKMSGQGS